MEIYIVVCVFSVFIAVVLSKLKINGNNVPISVKVIVTALPSIFITGLRYGIGTDYYTYENWFLISSRMDFFSGNFTDIIQHFLGISDDFRDPLFMMYNQLIDYLGGDFYISIFVLSIITFGIIFFWIYYDSPSPWLSTYLLFGMTYFYIYMNAMRQMVAQSFLVLALVFFSRGKKTLTIIFFLIAIAIHHAAWFFLPVFLFSKIKIDARIILFITPLIFISSYVFKEVFASLISVLNYSQYTQNGQYFGVVVFWEFLWQILLTLLSYWVYYIDKAETIAQQNTFKIYFNIQVFSLWIYAFSGQIAYNEMHRILWIYGLPSIVFTSMVINRISNRWLRYSCYTGIVVGFFIYMYVLIDPLQYHRVIPYESIFEVLH